MVKCKYEGTGIWDGRCIGTKEVDSCPGYDKCKQYKPNYTTNADRIRTMADEELAEFIKNIKVRAVLCKAVKNNNAFEELCSAERLRQPVKEEEDDYA